MSDYLVRARFPNVNLANHELTVRQARDSEFKETRRQAEAFRLKLMEIPSDELGRLVAEQTERDREAKRLKAEREERERSFNRPDAMADWWAERLKRITELGKSGE